MIRVLIAEDDPRCYQELERFLDDYSRETGRTFQITHYDNGEDLVEGTDRSLTCCCWMWICPFWTA